MKLKFLIIHCTATPENREVSPKDIYNWHINGRGWNQVGYSELIQLDGKLITLVEYNDDDNVDSWEITNGVRGKNAISRSIVYSGGCDKNMKAKDTRTEAQKKTMEMYIKAHLTIHPNLLVAGHRQFSSKSCPSFDTVEYLRSINVQEKNIYKKLPFRNKAEGNAFRLWVNNYYSDYAKSIDLDKQGSYKNDFIFKAYQKLAKEYNKKNK